MWEREGIVVDRLRGRIVGMSDRGFRRAVAGGGRFPPSLTLPLDGDQWLGGLYDGSLWGREGYHGHIGNVEF